MQFSKPIGTDTTSTKAEYISFSINLFMLEYSYISFIVHSKSSYINPEGASYI